MTANHEAPSERARALMMAALDGELSSVEQAEFDRLLSDNEALRQEWERLKTVKEVTGTMTFRQPPEEVWDAYWEETYRKVERGVGWLLLSLGALAVFVFAGWHAAEAIIADTEIPLWVKLGIFAIVIGGGILFVSVARERWFTRRHDSYREVQR